MCIKNTIDILRERKVLRRVERKSRKGRGGLFEEGQVTAWSGEKVGKARWKT